MWMHTRTALLLLFLSGSHGAAAPQQQHHRLPTGMHVCKNSNIVRDIPGGPAAVLAAGLRYLESMRNNTRKPFATFTNQWRTEVDRVQMPQLPPCHHLVVFGDERRNYDEAKRFCYLHGDRTANSTVAPSPLASSSLCVVYSIGSNNKWDFEEHVHRYTNCSIETFDCTVDTPTVPPRIQDRTRFHKLCLGARSAHAYRTLPELNSAAGRRDGPDYLKIDVEGHEWKILRGLVAAAHATPALHRQLPAQIYAEFHLDLDKDAAPDSGGSSSSGLWFLTALHSAVFGGGSGTDRPAPHVGHRLRAFFDELFLKGGYMIMHKRYTLQTRNTDLLLVKVFCPPEKGATQPQKNGPRVT